jgi:hypothetical protein
MHELVLRPPLLLIMLGAALWTFWLALKFPTHMPRTWAARLCAALLEGIVCTFVWTSIQALVEMELTWQALSNGAVSGLVWTGTAAYSKSRYQATGSRRR